jgi:phage terminase large subunit
VRSAAEVFQGKWTVSRFEAPANARFYYGADWGFSQDPTVLVRCYVEQGTLYIDHEAWGVGVEIDETPALFRTVPGVGKWPIKADSARPETISALRRAGFNIHAARKWPGCVEDGIAVLRGFKQIVIHERCKHAVDEMKLYRYKVDRVTNDVLPLLAPGHDHVVDSIRYALDGVIKRGGDGAMTMQVSSL